MVLHVVNPSLPPTLPTIPTLTTLSADLSQSVHARPRPNSLLPPGPLPRRAGAVRAHKVRRRSYTHKSPPSLHLTIPVSKSPKPVELVATDRTTPPTRRYTDPPTATPWTDDLDGIIDLWGNSRLNDGEGFKEVSSPAQVPAPLRLSTVSPLVVPSARSTMRPPPPAAPQSRPITAPSPPLQPATPPSPSLHHSTPPPPNAITFNSILHHRHIRRPSGPDVVVTPPKYLDDNTPPVALALRERLDAVLKNWGDGTSPATPTPTNAEAWGEQGFMTREEGMLSWHPRESVFIKSGPP